MFKTPNSTPCLVVERFPTASGTNPQFSEWVMGPCVFCPRNLSEPFLTFLAVPCPPPVPDLRPAAPGPPALPHCSPACGRVSPGFQPRHQCSLETFLGAQTISDPHDLLSYRPRSFFLAFILGVLFSELQFICVLLICKLGHLLIPGPQHLANNYPVIFTFHMCFYFSYTHTFTLSFLGDDSSETRWLRAAPGSLLV